jgi:predicted GNAT family N-acyltransferase
MYIYNITTNVDESILDQWIEWMQNTHIPTVLKTGKFTEAKMCRVMVSEEMGGLTYSIQFTANSLEDIESFSKNEGIQIENEAFIKFGEKQLSFRTNLELISTH